MNPQGRKQTCRNLVLATIILTGIAVSTLAGIVLQGWERERIMAEFRRLAKERHAALQRQIALSLQAVESIQAFYAGSMEVDREEFRAFVSHILARHKSIQALEWIPRIPGARRGDYERRARREGSPAFQITVRNSQGRMVRSPERGEHFPVYFVEPYRGNEIALGFDLASNPTRRESLERSRDRGELLATARITLVQEKESQFGMLVFAPIYRNGAPADTVEARRQNLLGFALGVFRIGDILDQALTYLDPAGIDLYLHDRSAPEEQSLLCSRPSRLAKPEGSLREADAGIRLELAETLDVGGRQWELRCRATPEFIAARKSWLPWGSLGGGLFLTTLVAGYFLTGLRRTAQIESSAERLRQSEERFRGLLESAADGMVVVNAAHEILMVNAQLEKMFGYERAELLGRPVEMLIPSRYDRHREHGREYFRNPQSRAMGQTQDLYALRKDGGEFPVEISLNHLATSEGVIAAAAVRDISERKRYEERLEYQATHDGLTGLPNRTLLADRIHHALPHAYRFQRQVAVLFIDLDQFKFINDSLGHDAGDRLLQIVAERLSDCIRANDTVARQGGDEFVVVISDLVRSEDAAKVARQLQLAVSRPIRIVDNELEISCSIGISIYPKDGEEVQTLLKNADAAMFRAKEQGRNNFQFFTGELNDRAVARMTMERCLRRALEREELRLHYQPQVDLRTGRITGMEALLRWESPELGPVAPDNFIPLAEETGLIAPIGEWVLRTACAQNRSWQQAGHSPLTMAVNLSPRQFRQEGLVETVGRILRETDLEARHLEVEIVESLLMHDLDETLAILKGLKALGVRLTMDDFGTGYSSLSYLKRFPFDRMKIDKSFVRDVTSDSDSAAIVRAIIAMAHSLNLGVIAEGIETEEQLGHLRSQGCDEMQGFYFSRPVPPAEFEQMLRKGRRLDLAAAGKQRPVRTVRLPAEEGIR
jgi:diguanylate cyclase (GGDEF)-like protein/PAS domain S-box-containing protein